MAPDAQSTARVVLEIFSKGLLIERCQWEELVDLKPFGFGRDNTTVHRSAAQARLIDGAKADNRILTFLAGIKTEKARWTN